MAFRASVRDFQLANPLYVGAEVRFFTVDVDGVKTTTLATLYANPTGSVQLLNPQTLDGDGKFAAPVYFEQPMVAEVIGATVGSGETGIIQPVGRWREEWATATLYLTNDFVLGPASPLTSDSGDVFVCNQNFLSGATIAADIAAGLLVRVFDAQDFQAQVDAAELAAAEATAALATLQVQRRRVLARLTSPPGAPATNDSYIILSVATGAWAGQENKIATWDSAAWVFTTPISGWSAYSVADLASYDFNGTAWVPLSIAAGAIGSTELADDAVTTAKLDDDAVTFAKVQNIATARLLGRTTAGAGAIEELTADTAEGLLGAATARLFPAGSSSAPGVSPVGDADTGIWSPAANTIAVSVGAAEKTRVDSSGVKIATTTTLDSGGVLQVSGLTTLYNTAGATPLFIVNPGSGSQTLVAFRQGGPASTVGTIVVSGGTSTAYNTSSDYRLKENVADIDLDEAKAVVDALTPRRFCFKADPGTVVDGFLAHEVAEAAPNARAITGEKDGEQMQGIDPSKLIATLTAALKWAIREIEELKAR